MSYREIRNITEHLKALGFPRTISIENFSTPNFPLLTEIILWAIKFVEHDYEVSGVIDTEDERVLLIRIASIFFYQKLGIRLNTVKLYGADKLAARELLKVTSSLYRATRTALDPTTDDGGGQLLEENFTINITGKELREVRQLASSIVMDAASLHDNLNQEVDDKMKREATLNQALDIDRLEATLVAALHELSGTVEEIKEATEQLEKQKSQIEEKIQKKKESLIRNTRRLEALNRIKPTWQSEFEQEEIELRATWDEYITKHKNLTYLEEQLEELEEVQRQQLKTAMQRGREAAAADFIALEGTKEQQNRNRRVFGSMTGENVDSSEDSESTDSFLNDSASDDDSLTLISKDESLGTAGQAPVKTISSLPQKEESPHDYSLYPRPSLNSSSDVPVHGRPSSARPKSARLEARVNGLTAWTNNVKGSERVSPLSVSEDNSDGF